ncbi:hypothetical protein I4U23_017745 [Adineta vaga]|nr:hypothetical protein I4U23_017745 [Adineta vaga]
MNRNEFFDVVIIGEGFAGRPCIGGRKLSGQWIGPKRKRILSLIDQFNFHLIEQTWYHQDSTQLRQQLVLSPLTIEQIDNSDKICSEWSQISFAQFIHEHPLAKDYRTEQESKLHILTLWLRGFVLQMHLLFFVLK